MCSTTASEVLESPARFKVVEGIGGVWHYHLAQFDAPASKGLCGAQTMPCGIKLESWGFKPTHFRSSYCAECASLGGIEPTILA